MKLKIDERELEFPQLDTLTFREAGLIKKMTGLRMGEFEKAFNEGDTDIIYALALVAKSRADGTVDADALLDTPITAIDIVLEPGDVDAEDEEAENGPPAEAADAAAEVAG